MKLIVGLGNPGPKYTETRHNFGKLLARYIADQEGIGFKVKKSLQSSVAVLEQDGGPVVFACPELYMNVSGAAVSKLVSHYEVDCGKDLLILVDDVALPLGRLRLRGRGSDGGHNGLKSVNQSLHTTDYARLRLGIGHPSGEMAVCTLEDYVLGRFEKGERAAVTQALQKGYEACLLWMGDVLESAMNIINACN